MSFTSVMNDLYCKKIHRTEISAHWYFLNQQIPYIPITVCICDSLRAQHSRRFELQNTWNIHIRKLLIKLVIFSNGVHGNLESNEWVISLTKVWRESIWKMFRFNLLYCKRRVNLMRCFNNCFASRKRSILLSRDSRVT